jgi:MFS family permease
MTDTVSVEHEQPSHGSGFFHGNTAVIAASNAIKGFGRNIINTYIPVYFLILGGSPLTLGLMTSVTSVIQCLMLLIGGFIADYYGRRKVIVFTAFYSMIFPLLYAFIQDWRIFVALSIMGVFGTLSVPASQAIVADSLPPEKRTTGIASLQVISSLPLVVAPVIGGWLIQNQGLPDGFRLACMYAVATAFFSALVVFLSLKETLRRRPIAKSNATNSSKLANSLKLPRSLSSGLKALMIPYALVVFANGVVGRYYILYAYDTIGITALEWGVIAGLQFLLANVLKIPGGWLSDKFGKRKIMIISVLTCAPCTILFIMSQSFLQALMVALLLIVTGIYYTPAHTALQSDLTPRTMRGRVTALFGMASALAAASGSITGGFLFQSIDSTTPFYLFTAAELMAAFFLISIVQEPLKKEV